MKNLIYTCTQRLIVAEKKNDSARNSVDRFLKRFLKILKIKKKNLI